MAIKKIISVWWILAKNNFQGQILTVSSAIFFIIGKLFNFLFTLLTIFAIFTATSNLNGYSLGQAVIFVIVYNFLESLFGFIFRAIYTFRPYLFQGSFDYDLLRPLPSFFRPLFSTPDFLDFPPILIQFIFLLFYLNKFHFLISLPQSLFFVGFLFISLLLTFSIFLLIAAFGIIFLEVDGLVWIFRSLARAATVPTDIYSGLFRLILDFVVPITIMFTLPTRAILNILTPHQFIYASIFTIFFLLIAICFWRFSLKHYSSASS